MRLSASATVWGPTAFIPVASTLVQQLQDRPIGAVGHNTGIKTSK